MEWEIPPTRVRREDRPGTSGLQTRVNQGSQQAPQVPDTATRSERLSEVLTDRQQADGLTVQAQVHSTEDGQLRRSERGNPTQSQHQGEALGSGSPDHTGLIDADDEMDGISSERFAEAKKELISAKASFTKTKGRILAHPENLNMLSDAELLDVRTTWENSYARLRSCYEKAYKATSKGDERANLANGLVSYQKDYDELLGELNQESNRRAAVDSTPILSQNHEQALGPSRIYPLLMDLDEGSLSGAVGDTPFRTVNQSVQNQTSSVSEGQCRQASTEIRNVNISGANQNRTAEPSSPSIAGEDRRPTGLSKRRKRGKNKEPSRYQGGQSQSFTAPSGVGANAGNQVRTSRTIQVDSLDVARMVQAASAANWGPQRIKTAIDRMYQNGTFPEELLRFRENTNVAQGGPRASTAMEGMGNADAAGFVSRAVNFQLPQEPAPSFVRGVNSVPLGQLSGNPSVQHTQIPSAISGFRPVPVVPMPQSQPTIPSMVYPPLRPLEAAGEHQPSYTNPMHATSMAVWPPSFSQPPPPTQSFVPTNSYQYTEAFRYAGQPQPIAYKTSAFPPDSKRMDGGMFGNHSFSQDARARTCTMADQINWGYDPRAHLEKPLMKINHVTFDGSPRSCSFEEFRSTYAIVCGGRNMPESQKLICLKQLLAGDPLKIFNNIVGVDLAPGSLERVLRTLEDHFGGPQRIVNSYINRLTQYPQVRKFDCSSLLDLLTIIEEIYNRYETHNPGFLEQDEVLVSHIRRIIPSDERQMYYSKLAEHRRRDTFLTVRDYLKARYESFRLAAIADAGLSLKQSTHNIQEETIPEVRAGQGWDRDFEDQEVLLAGQESEGATKGRGIPYTSNPKRDPQTSPAARPSGQFAACSFCAKDHPIWRCPDFKLLDVKHRYTHVREKKLCFHCLLPGHRIQDCKFKPDLECGLEGCKRKHHRLVHNHTETGLCSIEVFMRQSDENENQDVEVQVQKSLVSMSLATESRPVVLPLEKENIAIRTVTLEIRCGDSRKRVLAALDSCSNNTNIDADLAEELGLPKLRSNVPREMHFLERKAQITSDFVKFVLAPLGSDATFELTGFTVKNLMIGTPVIDWNEAIEAYPHLKEADIPRPKPADRIQILIGTEFAELMTPYRVLRGPTGSGAPIAELTDLGWAFSGRTNQKRHHHTACQADCSLIGHTLMSLGTFDRVDHPRNGCMTSPVFGQGVDFGENSLELFPSDFDRSAAFPGCESPHRPHAVMKIYFDTTSLNTSEVSSGTMGAERSTDEDPSADEDLSADEERSTYDDEKSTRAERVESKPRPVTSSPKDLSDFDVKEGLETYLELQDVEQKVSVITLCQSECDKELNQLMQRHWELEAIGLIEKAPRISSVKDPSPQEWSPAEVELDQKIEIIYLEEEEQFQMSIPWKSSRPDFKSNRFAVKKRQESTLRSLGHRLDGVRKIFESYLEKGYIRKLHNWECHEQDCRYLPFFCVIDETKDTTPVRIVWDCRAVYDGKSLNSEIEQTPNRLQDLFKVLLRLRKYKYTITSDVSEMFLKILMDPRDRRFHRFVFEGNDYEWNVILFGNVSSPNGSQKVLAEACKLFGEKCPEAVETLSESCYMDDASDSRATEEEALALTKQLIELLGYCKMPIHKFYTNSLLVIRNIDPALLAKQITLDEKDVTIDSGKILGMKYSVDEGDVLMFAGKFKSVREWTNRSVQTSVEEGRWTKRLVSRAAASIYDPHGLIAPFTVRAKVILQEIWKHKDLGWDDCLPPELCQVWETWLEQVFEVPEIHIPRWSHFEPRCHAQLHTFCDASEDGMCCAVYLRVRKGQNTRVTLLAAKARVSPLRAESISRLELCACVMGTRLCAAVKEVYQVATDDIFFWTDSEVCLHWINTPAKSFKAYVAHRVGEIQTYTEPRQWLHVPTLDNPADIGTRPITAGELKRRELWWGGPTFLRQPVTDWPKSKVVREIETKELKNTVFLNIAPLKETRFTDSLEKLDPRFFSVGKLYNGLQTCLRKWAYVIRAVRLFRAGRRSGQKQLHAGELEAAKRHLICQAQLTSFRDEIGLLSRDTSESKSLVNFPEARKSRILQFAPFLDEFGILRSRSRLEKSNIYGYDKTYPVILDRHSDLTRLFAEEAHVNQEHPIGHNALKASLSSHFIIIGLGTLCHQIKFRCSICRMDRGKHATQLQAALPERRLGERLRPFAHVGMDYAGPFEVKMGRGKPRKKLYVLVLTCMAVRAVHLEATGGQDTTHVVNAISRFVDVRGLPETITTDNQTSFTKADKDLTDWIQAINFQELQEKTGGFFRTDHKGIEWIFNPPLAPHFGGVFEIMVKAMKRALQATVARADLTEEEFRTVISKISWMLNNRPIQPTGDSADLEVLTPNHFLNGAPESSVFPPDLPSTRIGLQERLRYQVEVQQHFWKRFQTEIVPLLGPRTKWKEEFESLKIDDVVIEIDENTPRGEWRKMRITRVLPSSDKLIRKVEVTNGRGKFYVRPITRLIPIVL